ncbi:Hsp20/alpha crystallin family protein [Candidatus Micrarchaeota archaeon]|nr:Hsp20/alpha crystallin family protein [Candidatus Micrarchaeota archaeon]
MTEKRIKVWDPWNELMSDFINWPVRPFSFEDLTGFKAPLLDIEDRGKELVIVADMPGINKEDIDIEVEPDHIKISAESQFKTEKKKKNYYYQERRHSGFSRMVSLPVEVIPGKAKAEYKNGVLRVYLPKAKPVKEKKAKKIKVK